MTVSAADAGLVTDLAVDTSAVLAMLLREPTGDAVLVKLGELGQECARELLEQQAILKVAWDQKLADASGLNCGDCFSYALAKRLRVPLLFVGNDFSQTDREPLLNA